MTIMIIITIAIITTRVGSIGWGGGLWGATLGGQLNVQIRGIETGFITNQEQPGERPSPVISYKIAAGTQSARRGAAACGVCIRGTSNRRVSGARAKTFASINSDPVCWWVRARPSDLWQESGLSELMISDSDAGGNKHEINPPPPNEC